jgi:hypothetical protein
MKEFILSGRNSFRREVPYAPIKCFPGRRVGKHNNAKPKGFVILTDIDVTGID